MSLRAVRLGMLVAASVAIVLSLPAAEWLVDGWRPHRVWPMQLAVFSAVGWLWRHLDRRVVAAIIGALMGGAASAIAVAGVDGFAPGGAGLGPRVPLVVCAAVFLALHGLLAAIELRCGHRSAGPQGRWWPGVLTAGTVIICTVLTWVVVFVAAGVNDQHTVGNDSAQPSMDDLSGTAGGTSGPFASVTSTATTTVVSFEESRPIGQSVDVPQRTVVARVSGPPGPSKQQSYRWTFSRAGAALLHEPILSSKYVYIQFAQWGFLGTDDPESPTNRAGASTSVVVLDADNGSAVDEFGTPGNNAAIIDADDNNVVFAQRHRGELVGITVTDRSGENPWHAHAPEISSGQCHASTASLAGDNLLVSSVCDDNLQRVRLYETQTRDTVWERDLGEAVAACGAAPHQTDTTLVVSTCGFDGISPTAVLMGLDPVTGADRWRTPTPGLRVFNHMLPAHFYSPLYAVTYRAGTGIVVADNDGVTVLDPDSGAQIVRHDLPLRSEVTYPAVYPTTLGVVIASAPWQVAEGPTTAVWIN